MTVAQAPPPPKLTSLVNLRFGIPSDPTSVGIETRSSVSVSRPSISAMVRPASATAFLIASQARSSSSRCALRENSVWPMPTIAVSSLIRFASTAGRRWRRYDFVRYSSSMCGRPFALLLPSGPELEEREVVSDVGVNDIHGHADSHVLRCDADDVADEPRSFLELDEHDGVGRHECRMRRPAVGDEAVDGPVACRRHPLVVARLATRAHRARRCQPPAARSAALQEELAGGDAVPERSAAAVQDLPACRPRDGVGGVVGDRHAALRSSLAASRMIADPVQCGPRSLSALKEIST